MSNKNIVVILGSPRRKGNSALVAESFIKGAEENGSSVKSFFIQNMDIKPCNACNSCLTKPNAGCIINDDMQQIYPEIESADTIVLASPIYWFNITAQMKLFIDRCYALIRIKDSKESHAFKGKDFVIILTYGDSDPFRSGAVNALRSYQDMLRYVGANIKGVLYGTAGGAGQIKENPQIIEKAYLIGKKISS